MTNAPLAQTVIPGVKVGEGKDVLEGGGGDFFTGSTTFRSGMPEP